MSEVLFDYYWIQLRSEMCLDNLNSVRLLLRLRFDLHKSVVVVGGLTWHFLLVNWTLAWNNAICGIEKTHFGFKGDFLPKFDTKDGKVKHVVLLFSRMYSNVSITSLVPIGDQEKERSLGMTPACLLSYVKNWFHRVF